MAEVEIRSYADGDESAVLDLLADALERTPDVRHRDVFRWKHLANPFGRSFLWVAEIDGELAGFRAFVRWRLVHPTGRLVHAVHGVDVATAARFRGLGVFRSLTLHALDEMRAAGVELVFNTPNDNSRPGYLSMGWEIEGRVPVTIRPRTPAAMLRMLRARTAAESWSLPLDVGVPVGELGGGLEELRHSPSPDRLVTERSAGFLRWRYGGCAAIASRVVPAGPGYVFVRFRRRGSAIECTVGDVVGAPTPQQAGAAVRSVMRDGGADYAIATRWSKIAGMIPVTRLGPVQTRRAVSDDATALPLALTLGDVEMF